MEARMVREFPAQVWLHVITDKGDLEPFLPSLVSCYKVVFRGHPYLENHDGKEIPNIVEPFLNFSQSGVVILAVASPIATGGSVNGDGVVVGFGASICAELDPDVSSFLLERKAFLEVDVCRYLYMAELGVLPPFRQSGLGTLLITGRVDAVRRSDRFDLSHVIMRTAKNGSMSLKLYEKLGAKVINHLVQVVETGDNSAPERIFLSASFEGFGRQNKA